MQPEFIIQEDTDRYTGCDRIIVVFKDPRYREEKDLIKLAISRAIENLYQYRREGPLL
jgi:hypothetical protein